MQPLNLGQTLTTTVAVVRRELVTLVKVVVVLALAIELLDVVIISSTTTSYAVGSGLESDTTTYDDRTAFVLGQVAIAVLDVLQYLVATAACYRVVASSLAGGGRVGAEESLRFGARRALPTLWLVLLILAALFGVLVVAAIPAVAVGAPGLVALIVPLVLWLAVAWAVAVPALLGEGLGPVQALRRSFALVRGHWWATFGRLLVATVLVAVAAGLASGALDGLVVAVLEPTAFAALAASRLLGVLVTAATTPLLVAVTTVIYLDLRRRVPAPAAGRAGFAPPAPAAPSPRPLWSDGDGERDAFGHPVPPRPASAPPAALPGPPGGWAPPQAPRPRPPG